MRDTEFNDQVNIAVRRIRSNGGEGVAEEQARLRGLVPLLTREREREWAVEIIESLPSRAIPSTPSPLMAEALDIQKAALAAQGTDEELVAVLEAARKKIWEIADRAGDEAPNVRALTRTLEHFEDAVRDPHWDEPWPTRNE